MEKENVFIETVKLDKHYPMTMDWVRTIFDDYHDQSCCENHFIDWNDSKWHIETASEFIKEFNEVDISWVPDMWIVLRFRNTDTWVEFPVFFAWRWSNNWYYSHNLYLVISVNWFKKEISISEYQDWEY